MAKGIKRIEFNLNLDDPEEAKIYELLRPSIQYRRAGAIIRHALAEYFQRRDGYVNKDKLKPGVVVGELVNVGGEVDE